MYEQIATDFPDEWAIKVSIISDQLTETINAIREKDRECNGAFLEFHDVIKEIYPSLDIQDCVHMIAESMIIAPIKKTLFNQKENELDADPYIYEQKIAATLEPYELAPITDKLQPLYEFIKRESLRMDRQQLIKEVYEEFYRAALPNRVIRHKKAFGL